MKDPTTSAASAPVEHGTLRSIAAAAGAVAFAVAVVWVVLFVVGGVVTQQGLRVSDLPLG